MSSVEFSPRPKRRIIFSGGGNKKWSSAIERHFAIFAAGFARSSPGAHGWPVSHTPDHVCGEESDFGTTKKCACAGPVAGFTPVAGFLANNGKNNAQPARKSLPFAIETRISEFFQRYMGNFCDIFQLRFSLGSGSLHENKVNNGRTRRIRRATCKVEGTAVL